MKTFVEAKGGRRPWMDEQRFMELMSLGQAMPGPTSTQMATAMGISRAGPLGGALSFWLFDWVGFSVQLGVGCAIHSFEESASTDALDTYKMVMLGMGPAAISQLYVAAYKLGLKVCGNDAIITSEAARRRDHTLLLGVIERADHGRRWPLEHRSLDEREDVDDASGFSRGL